VNWGTCEKVDETGKFVIKSNLALEIFYKFISSCESVRLADTFS
jgi:hypothetical protein